MTVQPTGSPGSAFEQLPYYNLRGESPGVGGVLKDEPADLKSRRYRRTSRSAKGNTCFYGLRNGTPLMSK